MEQGAKKGAPSIPDRVIDRALMGQSMMFSDARLVALLTAESDDDDSDVLDDDTVATADVVAAPTAKVFFAPDDSAPQRSGIVNRWVGFRKPTTTQAMIP